MDLRLGEVLPGLGVDLQIFREILESACNAVSVFHVETSTRCEFTAEWPLGLAGFKPKEGQSKDSIDGDDNLQMRDHHDSFPQAKEEKALRTLTFCLPAPEVRHLTWRPKHLGVAYESTCVRRGCHFVADSSFSLSHHLEHGHWLLVSLNQSSQAASFSRPVDLACTHRIMSRKFLRCGGAASVKYSYPVCSAYFVAAHGLLTHVSKFYAQGRLRSRQPPAPSPTSALLESLMTLGSGGGGGESAVVAAKVYYHFELNHTQVTVPAPPCCGAYGGHPRNTTVELSCMSRVQASGTAPPGVGYDWLMTANEPEMAIPVPLVFVGNHKDVKV
ncbi:unnamed protein product [Schistocephalus solidus]|uniref:ApaG domain-containing protein n=1 Tax=Schistocephalus solidus TaxID=70667 RepID=A0A183STH3_SCHSO|nr:unnamed protein product [Schistocephalus solidus]